MIVATKLFADNGYKNVTIREIAKKANINAGNISYHFGGKFGLYEAIVDELIAKRTASIAQMNTTGKSTKEIIMTVHDNRNREGLSQTAIPSSSRC